MRYLLAFLPALACAGLMYGCIRMMMTGSHRSSSAETPELEARVQRQQSQWFECPCHGSKYNTAGEYKLGPAPRGMDRFKVNVSATGDVTVDTAEIILGPPRGTDTIHKPLAGPFCVAVQ